MNIHQYLDSINQRYQTGISREHAYRGDLQQLLESLLPGVMATNEPARINCGAPDYVLTRKDVPLGYIEAKDIGIDLSSKTLKEQFDRYKAALDNLVFTDYLDFHFYKSGELISKIAIAEIQQGRIVAKPENFAQFTALIENFALQVTQSIKSPTKLAEMMAAKAKLMALVIEEALKSDDASQENSELKNQLAAFKSILIHDIDNRAFADIYAQTIAYGLFAARYHDPSLPTFSRQEAATLIPKSNPFLRKLFQFIAGPDLDPRLVWIVDELVNIFLAADVAKIMHSFGKSTRQDDPIIHFYETFLAKYDAKLRKARGVWYTPEPVVNFIVRAVDDILQSHFNLPSGLADTSKIKIKRKVSNGKGKFIDHEEEVHRVQILDPATGTGTFLAQVVRHIHQKHFASLQGAWPDYVQKHLIPRLNGFELLMTSYAMAHLKLDMLLNETGYKIENSAERLQIYLTNSLEEHHPDTGTLFASWLSAEANEANHIKRDAPVMVVIGNPPYSGISSNNGEWIGSLIEDYKYIDGEHFKERKHWLNDDYVKFIRYGEHFIEKNGSGILAYINPHGFLDNPTFRGMRWHLLQTFDEIYTIDLHGNSKKKETSTDGGKDENVFDIMQGVSVNIFIKTNKKKASSLGKIFHFDLYGKRDTKYNFLIENSLQTISFKELAAEKPFLFFVPKNNSGLLDYESGFKVENLFPANVTGIVTARDSLVIDDSKKSLVDKIKKFSNLENSDDETRRVFFGSKKDGKYFAGDSRGWSLVSARQKISQNNHDHIVKKIAYRPFDIRYIYYTPDMVDWGREKYMQHFLLGENIGLVIPKISQEDNCFFISDEMIAHKLCSAYDSNSTFPLYLYHQSIINDESSPIERTPNLDFALVDRISVRLGLKFTSEKENSTGAFAPIDLLDYIYAVLHSPNYREKYKEFLKIDFPRVPYPDNQDQFWQLVALGGQLRQVHLLKSTIFNKPSSQYPVNGNNIVGKPHYDQGKVFINDTQYFTDVAQSVWAFYIGGYQPAQKWLKDRRERTLSFEDIVHYQKIITALTETERLMASIAKII